MESITLKIPRLGYQAVSDTWGLAKVVRKVEFKLLHYDAMWDAWRTERPVPGAAKSEQQNRSGRFRFLGGRLPASP
jgi:hypothetical protein